MKGVSVTRFVKTIDQPAGGYLPVSNFEIERFHDRKKLHPAENISPWVAGLVVDYMSRFMLSKHTINHAHPFHISLNGASMIKERDKADELYSNIKGLDAKSIKAACELVRYDNIYRGNEKEFYNTQHIIPNTRTIRNIVILVERTVAFLKERKALLSHITFSGAYNDIISSGDADFVDEFSSTLFDIKASKYEPTINDTLQLLIYRTLYAMADVGDLLQYICIFNPRCNTSYTFDMDNISDSTYTKIYELITLGQVVCTDGYEIDDEIPLVIISSKSGKRYVDLTKQEVLELLDNFKTIKGDPNLLCYNFAKIKIDAKSATSVSGTAIKTLYPYMSGETARYVGDSTWRICNSKALEYNFLLNAFDERNIDRFVVFKYFNKMLSMKTKSGI